MMKNKKLVNCLTLLIPLAFFIAFFFIDGYVICDDSESYIIMLEFREPLYPLIIDFFRKLLGENNNLHLYGVVLFQSLLAAYVAYNVVCYFSKEFELPNYIRFLILSIILGVSLLCRIAAKRGVMYSNSILSEGVAYPLFLLFFRYDFDYLIKHSKKSLIIASILAFLMISLRKQMYLSLMLVVLSILFVMVQTKKYREGFIKIALICVLVVGGFKLFDFTYMNFVLNSKGTHTSDNRFLTTMVFYTSEKEDAELIQDKEVKEMFLDIYNECDSKGYLKHSAKEGWFNRNKHFGDNYDLIQDYMWNVFRTKVWHTNGGIDVEQIVDQYNDVVVKAVLPSVLPKIISTLADSFLAGLMITVTADREYFIMPSIILYLAYIYVLIINIKKEGLSKYSILGLFTLVSIVLNVGIVSCVIFNQTRYTIYNMPYFYIAGLLMLYNVIKMEGYKL